MEKNIKIKIIVLLIAMIMISACARSGTGTLTELYTGKQGVVVTMQNTDIFKNIIEGINLPVNIKVQNKGAYDVEDAKIKIIYDNKLFEAEDTLKSFNLEGKKQYNPEGYQDIIEYNIQNTIIPSENKNSYIIAHTCYMYKTYAKTNICFGNPSSAGCDYKDYSSISLSNGQGAPVGISKITETVVESRDSFDLILDIYVDNFGDGQTTMPDKYSALCTKDITLTKEDKLNHVKLDVFTISEDDIRTKLEFSCQNINSDNSVDLSKRHIICTRKFEKEDYKSSYVTLLEIELSYGYVQTTNEKLTFQDIQKDIWTQS